MMYNYDPTVMPGKLRRAIDFVSKELNLDEEDINVSIDFIHMKAYERADVMRDDNDFEIRVNTKLGESQKIISIFHEFVHIKQYVDDRYETGFDYSECPFEYEAESRAKYMFEQFTQEENGVTI